jgi:mRNA interferase RelE/StbE
VSYRVEIKNSARKELAALPVKVQRLVDAAILALAETPRPRGAKKLTSEESLYRVRVGDYRIVYQLRDEVLLVLVVRIGHRRDVYRSF